MDCLIINMLTDAVLWYTLMCSVSLRIQHINLIYVNISTNCYKGCDPSFVHTRFAEECLVGHIKVLISLKKLTLRTQEHFN